MPGEVRAAQGQDGQQEQQQLQKKQPMMAQLLERRIGLRVGQKFLPQQRAGN